jgi:two-component sensor histidine kinase
MPPSREKQMQRTGATEGRRRQPAAAGRIPSLVPALPGDSEEAELLARAPEAFAAPGPGRERLAAELAAAREEAARLSRALAERDRVLERQNLLAREADYRVKNSLQLVTSVLTMQAAAAPGRVEGRALVQASNRVQAIAHAHGLLHRSGGPELLAFQDYLSSLCSDLRQSLLVDGTHRSLELDLEPVQLRADCAVALALIVNELVTNAFRHAFPDKRRGHVVVQVKRPAPDLCRLTVLDDGIGLRSWKMRGRTSGLGARIVGAMIQQLRARLEVVAEQGTRFTIEVPLTSAGG